MPRVKTSGSSMQSFLSVGTLLVAPTPQGGSSVAYSAGTVDGGAETPTTPGDDEQAAATALPPAMAETADLPSESFDSFGLRISTGPLASRDASPLGPILASVDAEATQQVDRHERAMAQEILGLDASDGDLSLASRRDDANREWSANRRERSGLPGVEDGPVVDAPGSGGFPMKVTSQRRGQLGKVDGLWATLPVFADSESPASSPEHREPRIP